MTLTKRQSMSDIDNINLTKKHIVSVGYYLDLSDSVRREIVSKLNKRLIACKYLPFRNVKKSAGKPRGGITSAKTADREYAESIKYGREQNQMREWFRNDKNEIAACVVNKLHGDQTGVYLICNEGGDDRKYLLVEGLYPAFEEDITDICAVKKFYHHIDYTKAKQMN